MISPDGALWDAPLPVAFEIRSRPYILGGGVTLEVHFQNEAGGSSKMFNFMTDLEENVMEPGWFARVILRETFEGRIAAAKDRLRARAHSLIAHKRRDQMLADVAADMLKQGPPAPDDGPPPPSGPSWNVGIRT